MTAVRTAPGALLRDPALLAAADTSTLVGFGGVHGGLVLALCVAAMRPTASASDPVGPPLRHATGRFVRRVPSTFEIAVSPGDTGRSIARPTATAHHGGRDLVTASAAFATTTGTTTSTRVHPSRPPIVADAPPPDRCAPFAIPTEFVPFTEHVEIRPVGANRPFAGGDDPTLTAWIRFVEDDAPPDELRLITLLDALAPSYAAVLDVPAMLPTVELTARISPALAGADSPWVLLHAETNAFDEGWADERIDAWSPAGEHLGSATQVRLLRG